jgi:hypothetical protein
MIEEGVSGSLVGGGPAMRASFPSSPDFSRAHRSPQRNAASDDAAAVLGPEHPLVPLLRACRAVRERMFVIATLQAASAAMLPNAPRLGGALLIAASAVQLALGLRLLVLMEIQHDLLRDLIVEGRPARKLRLLEREWRRLADPRRRARLARSLEQLADMAERPNSYLAGARPYFNQRVVREVAPELRELGAMLRTDDCGVRGVALLQTLQSCGTCALYGNETRPLRGQLARARYLLLHSDCAERHEPSD